MKKEKYIFNAEKLVQWKKNKGRYNFDTAPRHFIFFQNTHIHKSWQLFFKKKLKGLPCKAIFLNRQTGLAYNLGLGAPAVINLMEELRVLGTKHFYFIGYGGRLNPNIRENDIYFINEAYSLNGITDFYSKSKKIIQPRQCPLKFKNAKIVSTDAIFQETQKLINYFKQKKFDLIDMESAAILSFANKYGLDAFIYIIAADNLSSNDIWQAPEDYQKLIKTGNDLIKKLLKVI